MFLLLFRLLFYLIAGESSFFQIRTGFSEKLRLLKDCFKTLEIKMVRLALTILQLVVLIISPKYIFSLGKAV